MRPRSRKPWWRRRSDGLAARVQEGNAPVLRLARGLCGGHLLPLRDGLFLRARLPGLRRSVDAGGHAATDGWQPERHREHPPAAHLQHAVVLLVFIPLVTLRPIPTGSEWGTLQLAGSYTL